MAERPDRVSIPGILSEHASRLRALERSRPGFVPPKGDDFIDLWDDGVPQGLVRGLDFVGPGVVVGTTGDERGYVIVSQAPNAFDAIVDGAAAESDPANRLFLGVGEACDYLTNEVGLTSCIIGVRPGEGSDYTETANFDTPADVFLFGLRGTFPSGVAAPESFTWDWGGFKATAQFDLALFNGKFSPGSLASGVAQPLGVLKMTEAYLLIPGLGGGAFPTTVNLCSTLLMETCTFEISGNGNRFIASASSTMVGVDIVCRPVSSGTQTVIISGTTTGDLYMKDCRLSSGTGGTCNWTLPINFDMEFTNMDSRFSLTGNFVTFTVPTSGVGRINALDIKSGGTTFKVIATANFSRLNLEGEFGDVTASGTHSELTMRGTAGSNRTWDIKGPCALDVQAIDGASFIFRGEGTAGTIAGELGGSSGTFLDFIGSDDNCLLVGVDGSATSGTRKSYAFDASSQNNVLVFTNAGSFPVAGTNAGGATNRVLPEAAPPAGGIAPADADYLVGTANADLSAEIVVGPTPGGELGGTWPVPTVDATHSGSAHTDFIAKAFLDAKGDLISATADNTPAIVTVGADGEVLTADSTDPAGVSWQPGGGSMTFGSPVESQFGNTGSDGIGTDAARDDHVHDRHDDGVLFFSGINH